MIYFIRQMSTGLIKIGTTKNMHERVQQLRPFYGDLEIIAVMDGDRPVEKKLHRKFAKFREHHEFFRPSDELLDFIEKEGRIWDKDAEPQEFARIDIRSTLSWKMRAQETARREGQSFSELIRKVFDAYMDRQGIPHFDLKTDKPVSEPNKVLPLFDVLQDQY